MHSYTYKISSATGQVEEGVIKALTPGDAAIQIRRPGWFILYIRADQPFRFLQNVFKSKRLSSLERIVFTDHMAAMIESGTPMVEALETFKEDESKTVEMLITEIVSELQQGKKLSEAMSRFPKHFSPFYTSLISAGELTGRLDETLWYLAAELRREHEFKERLKSALIYPILVLVVATGVVTMLVTLVLPKLSELIKSFGNDMPIATRIVFTVSEAILEYGPVMLLGLAVFVVSVWPLLRQDQMKEKFDEKLLSVPLIGVVMKKYILARMLRILGSSLKYGIPLPEVLKNVSNVVGNIRYKNAIVHISRKIIHGQTLSATFTSEGYDLFPTTIVRTIKGAEKTGTVDAAMLRLSTFYEAEVDRLLKRMTDLIEPAMVIVLGIIVGAIAIGVVMPIYQLTGRIK